jgi:hypothetical protein
MLERYKNAESMPAVAKDQALGALLARGARGDLPRFDVDARPPVAPKAGLLKAWSMPGKMLAALGLAAVPAAVVVGAMTHRAPASPVPAEPPARIVAAPAIEPPSAAAEQNAPIAAAPSEVPAIDPPTPEPQKRAARATSAPRPAAPSASAEETASPPTIDGEVLLLNQAQLATRSGDPARALQILDQYAAEYPAGHLADARAVSRMVALCDLGRVADVRREAEQFKARFPSSPLNGRVNKICAGKTP